MLWGYGTVNPNLSIKDSEESERSSSKDGFCIKSLVKLASKVVCKEINGVGCLLQCNLRS